MTAGVRPAAPTVAVELSASDLDALELVLAHVKKVGMGAVTFNPSLLDPIRRKFRAAFQQLRDRPADLEGQIGMDFE